MSYSCKECKHEKSDVCSSCCSYQGGIPDRFEPKPKTNAERIRNMTDRELARLLCDFKGDCHECPADSYCEHGHNGMLYWLKEEVTE